jgi:hypothetical protein
MLMPFAYSDYVWYITISGNHNVKESQPTKESHAIKGSQAIEENQAVEESEAIKESPTERQNRVQGARDLLLLVKSP